MKDFVRSAGLANYISGGDGSDGCDGTFWEGAMTADVPADTADDAVQANIAAAGYGR